MKECGWEDQLRLHAKDVVREKGLERIKLEELTKEITPKVEKVKMSSEESTKKDFPCNIGPQFLTLHMYTGRKFVLHTNKKYQKLS